MATIQKSAFLEHVFGWSLIQKVKKWGQRSGPKRMIGLYTGKVNLQLADFSEISQSMCSKYGNSSSPLNPNPHKSHIKMLSTKFSFKWKAIGWFHQTVGKFPFSVDRQLIASQYVGFCCFFLSKSSPLRLKRRCSHSFEHSSSKFKVSITCEDPSKTISPCNTVEHWRDLKRQFLRGNWGKFNVNNRLKCNIPSH